MTGSRPVTLQQCQLVLEPSLPIHLISPSVLLLSPHGKIFLQPDLTTVANMEGSHWLPMDWQCSVILAHSPDPHIPSCSSLWEHSILLSLYGIIDNRLLVILFAYPGSTRRGRCYQGHTLQCNSATGLDQRWNKISFVPSLPWVTRELAV